MTTRVLVTGGLGFIGGHLVQRLLLDPAHRVTVVDDLSGTPLDPTTIIEQIAGDHARRLDVETCTVEEFAERSSDRFDVVYHLASIVGPAAVLNRSGWIAESILRNTYLMIRLAQRCKARLVNVSTSEIYGGGRDGYCHEETPRVVRGRASARQEYAAAKLAAEVAIENLCTAGALDAVTIRPFNVSGARQSGRGGFVLPRFVGQAILGRPLTVFGDGTQVRAFTDARDIAAGLELAARHGATGTAYNVGNPGNRVSIDELADRVLHHTDSSAGKIYVDPRTIYGSTYVEAADKFPDASRIMALGWQPRFTLDDTIQIVHAALRELPRGVLLSLTGLEQDSAVAASTAEPTWRMDEPVLDSEPTRVAS